MSTTIWYQLLPEHRHAICMEFLDFVSLVALAITCKRELKDTRLARGLRMTDPSGAEHIPPYTNVELMFSAGLRHAGYLEDCLRHYRGPTAHWLVRILRAAMNAHDEHGIMWVLVALGHLAPCGEIRFAVRDVYMRPRYEIDRDAAHRWYNSDPDATRRLHHLIDCATEQRVARTGSYAAPWLPRCDIQFTLPAASK